MKYASVVLVLDNDERVRMEFIVQGGVLRSVKPDDMEVGGPEFHRDAAKGAADLAHHLTIFANEWMHATGRQYAFHTTVQPCRSPWSEHG